MKKAGIIFALAATVLLACSCGSQTEQSASENASEVQEVSAGGTDTSPGGAEKASKAQESEPAGGSAAPAGTNDVMALMKEMEKSQVKQSTSSLNAAEDAAGKKAAVESLYREKGGRIALLTNNGNVMDGSYLQSIYEGIQSYAFSAEETYSYYSPASSAEADFEACMKEAIAEGASLIVCGGWDYDIVVGKYQYQYPEVDFLIVDGEPENEKEEYIDANSNVHCVYCDCTTAGYMAGYTAVLEGYRDFGFLGGEEIESVWLYGHGFMDGIEAAAEKLKCTSEVSLKYAYSGSWLPSREVYQTAGSWYEDGTEVIFACGGAMYQSVLQAAEEKNGKMIGVDVNQNQLSDAVITSAMNGVDVCVINALDEYFACKGWPKELAGQVKEYGPSDKCAHLPIDDASWKFKHVTLEDYFDLYTQIATGKLVVKDKEKAPAVHYAVEFLEGEK